MCAIQMVNGENKSAFEQGMVVVARHAGFECAPQRVTVMQLGF
jgi:hypothetical protein